MYELIPLIALKVHRGGSWENKRKSLMTIRCFLPQATLSIVVMETMNAEAGPSRQPTVVICIGMAGSVCPCTNSSIADDRARRP